jgi:hypothetical protein
LCRNAARAKREADRRRAPKSGSKESLILGEDEIRVDVEEQVPHEQEEHYVTVVHSTAEQGAIPKIKKDDKKKKKVSFAKTKKGYISLQT